MSFTELLKGAKKEVTSFNEHVSEEIEIAEAKEKKPEELLRGAGFKIKMVTPTSFGTQIDFAKKYDAKEIEKVLTNFTTKIKGKSVFIVD